MSEEKRRKQDAKKNELMSSSSGTVKVWESICSKRGQKGIDQGEHLVRAVLATISDDGDLVLASAHC
ncbi:hypothetical protein V6N13_091380 [Hibiscus sabdariffa]|uniref:Uncharacterized protein n=1 Tax=Hibiscus sabdariffa TaxID=183260 RepID=A0ABR2QE44_9ROSI